MIGLATQVVAAASMALMALAAAHKLGSLFRGKVNDVALLSRSRFQRRHAGTLLATAAVAELLVAVISAIAPPWGLLAATALVAGYTREVALLPPSESCSCFGRALGDESRAAALRRNTVIIGTTGAVGALALVDHAMQPLGLREILFAAGLLTVTVAWQVSQQVLTPKATIDEV